MLLFSRLTHCAAIKDNKSVKNPATSAKKRKTERFTQLGKPHLRTVFNAGEHMENSA